MDGGKTVVKGGGGREGEGKNCRFHMFWSWFSPINNDTLVKRHLIFYEQQQQQQKIKGVK